ncbi:MAG TPA: hypothetical protein VK306_04360 [Acidimicrobiales bacterium]|nr:hypothetical protein [Acidimicrobiales bacterium]
MSDTLELDVVDATEHTIIASPERDGWAIVDRHGRVVLTGGYAECLRWMGRFPGSR